MKSGGMEEDQSPLLAPATSSNDKNQYTVEDAIRQMGFGRFQQLMTLLCGFGLMVDILLLNEMAFLLPVLKHEWKLSKTTQGLLASATYVGMVFGAYFWGSFSDKNGRKLGFIWTLIVASIAGVISGFCHTSVLLALCRVVVGFGVGGNAPLAFTLFSELIPAEDRGVHMILIDIFAPVGMLMSCGFAFVTLSDWSRLFGWRTFCFISACPGLLVFVVRSHLCESPRYLVQCGKDREAKAVLYRIALTNRTSPPTGTLCESNHHSKNVSLQNLFHNKEYTTTTVLVWLVWVGLQLGSTGIHIWLPTFFRLKGIVEEDVPRVVLFTAFGEIPGLFLAALFVDRIGRKKTLSLAHTMAGLFTALFALTADLNFSFLNAFFLNFFVRAAHSVVFVYTSEVYPTALRARGLGLASSIARITGMASPLLGAVLLQESLQAALALYASAFLVAGIICLAFPIETAGRVLQDDFDDSQMQTILQPQQRKYPAMFSHVAT